MLLGSYYLVFHFPEIIIDLVDRVAMRRMDTFDGRNGCHPSRMIYPDLVKDCSIRESWRRY